MELLAVVVTVVVLVVTVATVVALFNYRVQLDCRHGNLSSNRRERGEKDLW